MKLNPISFFEFFAKNPSISLFSFSTFNFLYNYLLLTWCLWVAVTEKKESKEKSLANLWMHQFLRGSKKGKNIYYSWWNLVKHYHFLYQHQTFTLKFLPHNVQNNENKEAERCQTFTGIEITESRFWISPFLCLFTARYQRLWSAIKHCCPNFNVVHYLFLCTFFA